MKAVFVAALTLFLAACAGGGHNLTILEHDAIGLSGGNRPDGTVSGTIGYLGSTWVNAPMVREASDNSRGDRFQLVKTKGICNQENYTSFMIVADAGANADINAGGVGMSLSFSKGIYGGHVADYFGMAGLAAAMGGESPSFVYDCSNTPSMNTGGGADVVGPIGPIQ